ncbi:MAG: hypothetical protein NDJ92_12215 [Thermoanaerobaculia bacterium]|nr:hypothetical protein [Thermoanaerobaculia bacterium]
MRFNQVAASVFALVALGHAYRAFAQVPVLFGSLTVPVWASWVGAVFAAALSVWGFRSRD